MSRSAAHATAAVGASLALAGCDFPQATYSIPSSSMRPTIEKGMVVGADKIRGFCGATRPEPGDLVIYRRDGVNYISRAVAGPGQTVALRDGRLSIDGHPVATESVGSRPGDYGRPAQVIRETLANGVSYLTMDMGPNGMLDDVPASKVPPASWYVLGDNRDNAADSRVYGSVSAANLCATVTSVLWAKELSRVGHKP